MRIGETKILTDTTNRGTFGYAYAIRDKITSALREERKVVICWIGPRLTESVKWLLYKLKFKVRGVFERHSLFPAMCTDRWKELFVLVSKLDSRLSSLHFFK